jgi:hypothetical protein
LRWLQEAIREVGENGQVGKTGRKINLKHKNTAAISKVKPSIFKHIQIKLMVVNQYSKISTIYFVIKEGAVKSTLLLYKKVGLPTFFVSINRKLRYYEYFCISNQMNI